MSLATKFKAAAIESYLGSKKVRRGWHSTTRALMRKTREVTFWHRAGDPGSTLLAQCLAPLVSDYGVELRIVIVPPPAADVDPEPEKRANYALQDAVWLAAEHGLRFPMEPADPNADRLKRANAVLLVDRPALEQLRAIQLIGHALFADDADALASAVTELGCVPGQSVSPALEQNYAKLRRAGHYQGAMLHYGGEWYWGLDRLNHLVERFKLEGLEGPQLVKPPSAPPLSEALDVYFSFRSPYSYLALAQLEPSAHLVNLRPVLPMVMRGFVVPKVKVRYIARDAYREAERLGIDFGRICDPVGPGIERILAVHHHAAAQGSGFEFALRASKAIWSQAADMTDDEPLGSMAAEFGVDVSAAIADTGWRDEVERNREALRSLGLWGVPTFARGERRAWGQDRLARVAG